MLKSRYTIIVVLLLCAGVVLVGYFFVSNAIKQRQAARAQAALFNPETNNIRYMLKFKSPYMGDAANDGALNAHLPLGDMPRTYHLNPATRELDIEFKQPAQTLETRQLQPMLVYDATANFALIDNLQSIRFMFPDASYYVDRSHVRAWYDIRHLAKLTANKLWQDKVQTTLSNQQYVKRAFLALFQS